MITTGSKFLLGVGLYGIVATLTYVLASDFERTGMVTLGTLSVVALLLGFLTLAIRDGQVATEAYPDGRRVDVDTIGRGPLVSPSVFPILAAFGVALLLLGLAFNRWYTIFGAVLLVGVTVEWLVQSWSDRASDDGEYNRGLRNGVMHPIEFPVLGAIAVGLVIFGFSRVMLTVNKNAAVVIFIVVAGLILVVASLFAGLRRVGGDVLVGTLMVGGIIVLTAGVISFVQGERGFHEPEGEGANTESVADVASVAARSGAHRQRALLHRAHPASGHAGQHHLQQLPQRTPAPRAGGGRGPRVRRGDLGGARGVRVGLRRGRPDHLPDVPVHAAGHVRVRDRGRGRHRPHRGHGRGRVRRDPAFVRGIRPRITVDTVSDARRAAPMTPRRTRRAPRRLLAGLAGAVLLVVAAGCASDSDAPQDIFRAEGSNAQKIADLNFVYVLAAVVALLVFAVIAFVVWKFRDRKDGSQPIPAQLHGNTRLEIMWTIAPAVLLAAVAVPTVVTILDLSERAPDALEITVIGQQWWWEFDYPDHQGRRRAAHRHLGRDGHPRRHRTSSCRSPAATSSTPSGSPG